MVIGYLLGIGSLLGIGYWSFNGHWVFGPWVFFRHSSFIIDSAFGFRNSSFAVSIAYCLFPTCLLPTCLFAYFHLFVEHFFE